MVSRLALICVFLSGLLAVPVAHAADLVVNYESERVVVHLTPGANLVLLMAGVREYAGYVDEDGDGVILIPRETFRPGLALFVDVAAGTYVAATSRDGGGTEKLTIDPLPEHSILEGPGGEFTQIVLPGEGLQGLWIRPGHGAWYPTGGRLPSMDSDYNGFTITNLSTMTRVGAPVEAPRAFAPGDLFFSYLNGFIGGPVEPRFHDPVNPGRLLFSDLRHTRETFEGSVPAKVRIVRLGGTEGTVTVRCRTIDHGIVQAGVDYTAVDEIVTFAPGEMVKTVELHPLRVSPYGGWREVWLELSEVTGGATIETTRYVLGLRDNDPAPRLTISPIPASAPETNQPWTLSIRFKIASPCRVPVRGTLKMRSSEGDRDLEMRIEPGALEQELTIPIRGNTVPDNDLVMSLELWPLENAQAVDDGPFWMTVKDDDPRELQLPQAVTVIEGEMVQFVIGIAPTVRRDLTLSWNTADGTAVAAGGDYSQESSTWLVAGNTAISIGTTNDSGLESDETFYVDVTIEDVGVKKSGRVLVTIIDDDAAAPLMAMADVSVDERAGGGTVALHLPSPLSSVLKLWVKVNDGTAKGGLDFAWIDQPLMFLPGETSKTIPFQIFDDAIDESDEIFEIIIEQRRVRQLTARVTILDDDIPSYTSLSDAHVVEGASAEAAFRIWIEPPPLESVQVSYWTRDVGAHAGADYAANTGTVTFEAGESLKTITIPVLDDDRSESNEQFEIQIATSPGALLYRGWGFATIYDDDSFPPRPAVRVEDIDLQEGDSTTTATFRLVLSTPATTAVSVAFRTIAQTASASSDFDGSSGTITFAPGDTVRTIDIAVNGDRLEERDETFLLELSAPDGLAIAGGHAVCTILNDDDAIRRRRVRH